MLVVVGATGKDGAKLRITALPVVLAVQTVEKEFLPISGLKIKRKLNPNLPHLLQCQFQSHSQNRLVLIQISFHALKTSCKQIITPQKMDVRCARITRCAVLSSIALVAASLSQTLRVNPEFPQNIGQRMEESSTMHNLKKRSSTYTKKR